MNFIFEQNKSYIELYKQIEKTEELFEQELKTVSSTEENNPIISNIIVQYNNILTTKAIIFSCLLRNGFKYTEKTKNNVTICEIASPTFVFSVNKELLKNVLQNSFEEVMILAADTERLGSAGVNLNDTVKEQIEKEYRKEIKEQLIADVKEELHIELASDVRNKLEAEMKEDVVFELKKELNEEIKKELREELRATVETELRGEMSAQVRHELKTDLKEDVSQEIKQNIEQEIREKETERIRADINNEIQQKTDIVFFDEQTKDEEKIQLFENQLVCSKHLVTLMENGREIKKLEFSLFPLDAPVKGEQTSPSVVMAVNVDGKTYGLTSPKTANTVTFHLDEYEIDFIVRSKWTAKGNFSNDIYLNCTDSSYAMTTTILETKPKDFDMKQYLDSFYSKITLKNGLDFVLYSFPMQKENTKNNLVPILIYGIIGTQKVVHITDEKNETAVFEILKKHISISGKWDKDIFKKEIVVK